MQNIDIKLFGKVYDLTEDLSSEPSVIKVGDKEYKINTGFKSVMELDKVFKQGQSDITFVKAFLEKAFGKKASDELIALDKPMKFYKKIIEIVGDEIKGSDEEDSGNAS